MPEVASVPDTQVPVASNQEDDQDRVIPATPQKPHPPTVAFDDLFSEYSFRTVHSIYNSAKVFLYNYIYYVYISSTVYIYIIYTGPINVCHDSICTGEQEATSELACDFTTVISYDMHNMVW